MRLEGTGDHSGEPRGGGRVGQREAPSEPPRIRTRATPTTTGGGPVAHRGAVGVEGWSGDRRRRRRDGELQSSRDGEELVVEV